MFSWFKKPEAPKPPEPKTSGSLFSGDDPLTVNRPRVPLSDIMDDLRRAQPQEIRTSMAMDDSSNGVPFWKTNQVGINTISEALVSWYNSQGFINHQVAGIVAQNWLVNKACSMPAADAIRKGYDIVADNGDDIDDEAVKVYKKWDRKLSVNAKMKEFIRKGRIFGIRIAMFKVISTDPDYYKKPFNLDGVTTGSYKGIVQIDPYWVAPILDAAAASQPDSLHFYEPTWWLINGKEIHRSHLIIFRHDPPVDVLKPQYLYGGVPLPQQIMERVYAAERTANEAPMLAMSKRLTVMATDMLKVMANQSAAEQRLLWWSSMMNNYGTKLVDKENEEITQHETSLADLDAVIMTQYQLVAAISGVPATKLLGTSPKGFGASGDYEISSYHEMLESIQDDLTIFLERHHALVKKAYVIPAVGEERGGIETTVTWRPLDTPTAKELADTNLVKAQIDDALIAAGVIDSDEARQRVAMDKFSGYNELGLGESAAPGIPEMEEDPASEKLLMNSEKPKG